MLLLPKRKQWLACDSRGHRAMSQTKHKALYLVISAWPCIITFCVSLSLSLPYFPINFVSSLWSRSSLFLSLFPCFYIFFLFFSIPFFLHSSPPLSASLLSSLSFFLCLWTHAILHINYLFTPCICLTARYSHTTYIATLHILHFSCSYFVLYIMIYVTVLILNWYLWAIEYTCACVLVGGYRFA